MVRARRGTPWPDPIGGSAVRAGCGLTKARGSVVECRVAARRARGAAQPGLHLLNHVLQVRIDPGENLDLLVSVLALRVGAVGRARLQLAELRLHVAVELRQAILDLLGERDALLVRGVAVLAAVKPEAELDDAHPQAQDLDAHPDAGAARILRGELGRRRR